MLTKQKELLNHLTALDDILGLRTYTLYTRCLKVERFEFNRQVKRSSKEVPTSQNFFTSYTHELTTRGYEVQTLAQSKLDTTRSE